MDTTARKLTDGVALGRLNTVYRQSRVLQSAVELGLFELLAAGPAGEDTIREKLGVQRRFSRPLLDALEALGLVERDGGQYRNAEVAATFLAPGGPVDLSGAIRVAGRRHYAAWGDLTATLRAEPARSGPGGAGTFAKLYSNLDDARGFLAHMDSINGFVVPGLRDCLDWSRYSSFADVGGARGNIAARLVEAWPNLAGAVMDLPVIEPLFDEHMARLGTSGQVTFHAGDFFADPLPRADVLLFGHVLHDWTAEQSRELIARAHDAIPVGGSVVVYDQMRDDGLPDADAALAGMNVALMTQGGAEYSVAECEDWLRAAGLRPVHGVRLHTIGSDYLIVAQRD